MRRPIWVPALILAIALLTSNHAYADAIYNVQVLAGIGIGPIESSTGPKTAHGSGTVHIDSGPPPSIGTYPDLANAGASAIAGPNHLGVQAGANATANGVVNLTAPYQGYAELGISSGSVAIAGFTDTLQLSNAPTTGILDVYVRMDGSLLVDSFNNGFPLAAIDLTGTTNFPTGGRPNGTCVYLRNDTSLPPGCGLLAEGINLIELPYLLQANDTVLFDLTLRADDTCNAYYEGAPHVVASCLADTFFLDTAQVSSIVVADSNGNPVEGAYATSLSGVDYSLPAPSAVTPEVPTLALLGTGLIGVAETARRRVRA